MRDIADTIRGCSSMGWSPAKIARVLGMSERDVLRAIPGQFVEPEPEPEPEPPVKAAPRVRKPRAPRKLDCHQKALLSRLSWNYGPTVARSMMSGRDPRTKADLAIWRALGNPTVGACPELVALRSNPLSIGRS